MSIDMPRKAGADMYICVCKKINGPKKLGLIGSKCGNTL